MSALGLTTALVGDALWGVASWLCLGLPVTVALRFGGSRGGRG